MIEIKHLRLIQTLDQHKTLSATARALGYSQPAITQQIQAIERSIGVPIVVRTKAGIRFTTAGATLLRHAESVILTMDQAQSEIESLSGMRSGSVRVVSFPSAAATLIPRAFATIVAEFPGLGLTLAEAEPTAALEMIRAGDADIALVYSYATAGDVDPMNSLVLHDEVKVPIVEENIYLAVPPGSVADERRWAKLQDYADARWIAGCPHCQGNLVTLCESSGFKPNIAFETDDYVALQSLVAAGLGVAVIPDLILAASQLSSTFELRRINPTPVRMVSAVLQRSMTAMPGIPQAVQALRSAVGQLNLVAVP